MSDIVIKDRRLTTVCGRTIADIFKEQTNKQTNDNNKRLTIFCRKLRRIIPDSVKKHRRLITLCIVSWLIFAD